MHRLLPVNQAQTKQGPFATAGYVVLAGDRYYDPSDAHPARCDFPFGGYTHRLLPGRRPGAGEGLSSSRHHLPYVPRPITAGGVSAPPPPGISPSHAPPPPTSDRPPPP